MREIPVMKGCFCVAAVLCAMRCVISLEAHGLNDENRVGSVVVVVGSNREGKSPRVVARLDSDAGA